VAVVFLLKYWTPLAGLKKVRLINGINQEFTLGGRLMKQPMGQTGLPVEAFLTFVVSAK